MAITAGMLTLATTACSAIRPAASPATPEATVAAYTAACHAGDLDTARRLYPPDAISRQTELRMRMHEEGVVGLCRLLSHTRLKGDPEIRHDGAETTVFYRYEQPADGVWYPDPEWPPKGLSWHLIRQGQGWAINMVTGA